MECVKSSVIDAGGVKRYLHLMRFDEGGYEVQLSNDDVILDTDGCYAKKIDALKAFADWLVSLTNTQSGE